MVIFRNYWFVLCGLLYVSYSSGEIYSKGLQNNVLAKPDMEIAAGLALWAINDNYIIEMSADLALEIPLKTGEFQLEITFPIFLEMRYAPKDEFGFEPFLGFYAHFRGLYSQGYGSEIWPKLLSSPIYIITYIKNISWKTDSFRLSFSPERPDVHNALQNVIWNNPFYDNKTAILNRYLSFQLRPGWGEGAIYTSSLTSPALFLGYYTLRPAITVPDKFWSEWKINPVVWTDLSDLSTPGWGAGLETETGPIGNESAQLRFLADGHIFSSPDIPEESLSYRFDGGGKLQFRPLGFYLGYVYKSEHHPYGVFLSPLYPGRQLGYYSENTNNHGITFKLLPGIGNLLNAGFDVEVYPENPLTLSIKGQLGIKWEGNTFDLAYIHEDIKAIEDIFNSTDLMKLANGSSNYFEFHLRFYLIPEIFHVEWRHVINFDNVASIKTFFSVKAYF